LKSTSGIVEHTKYKNLSLGEVLQCFWKKNTFSKKIFVWKQTTTLKLRDPLENKVYDS
jgi:hypothetical protein